MKPQRLYATMAATLQAFLKDLEIARDTQQISALSAHLTPDCQRHLGPSTFLKLAGLPPATVLNNTAYEGVLAAELSVMESGSSVIIESTIDVEARKASMLTTFIGTLCGGQPTPVLNFTLFVDFTDDGSLIRRVVQWLDPEPALEESALVQQLVEQGVTCKRCTA
jgi:hypothetical protein